MENQNKLPTTDSLLVIRVNQLLNPDQIESLHTLFVNMKACGVVVLPPWCEVMVVPSDISIKMEGEKE